MKGIPLKKPIGGLIFDLGGVLVQNNTSSMLSALCALMPSSVDQTVLIERIRKSGIGTGKVTAQALLAELAAESGSTASAADWHAAWVVDYEPIAPMLTFIDVARQAGLKTALCSNTNALHWEHIDAAFGLAQRADHVALSHEVGCEKPDAEIYHRALAGIGLPADQIMFVDDRAENVAAATAIGMAGHVFESVDRFEAEVARFSVEHCPIRLDPFRFSSGEAILRQDGRRACP